MDFSKISKKATIFFLFFFGLTLVFWPVLSGQKIFNDNYVTNYAVGQTGYNFYKDFGSNLKQGHIQLWWSSYMGGFPAYLTQIGFFNPIGILLFRFFDYILAYNWLAFLNFLFAGLAMYWFIRNLKLSKLATILGGFTWALSFNNIQYGSIPIFSNVFPFIPLFFGAILKLSEGNKNYLIIGGLISGFGLIAGMTNIIFYTFIAGLAFALFLDWPKIFGKTFRGYIFVSLLGTILASVWLLPVLNYLPLTLRSQAVSSSIFFDYLKIGDALRFFYPFLELPGFGGFSLLSGVANLYIGVLPLFLAIIAMFFWRKSKMITFWFSLFIFAFSMRLWFFPAFQWLQYLPLFNKFRAPFHWYSLAFFSLAVLGAYGLDYMKEIRNFRWFGIFVKFMKFFAVLNVLFVLSVNLTAKFFRSDILNLVFGYFDKYLYSTAKKYSIDYYHGIITQVFDKSAASFSFSNYQFLISFIFVLMGALIFILYFKNYINFEKFRLWAVAISILNLVLIWQGYYNFTSKDLITNPPDTISFIQKLSDSQNFRVFRFYPPEMYQEFELYNLKNPLSYDMKTMGLQINPYWIDGFGGGEPFRSQRISEILDEIGYEIPATYSKSSWIKSNDISLADKISRFSSSSNLNLLSMLNIKYIFSSFKLSNLKLVYQTTATEKNIPVYIYENSEAMPRIYFAKSVKFVNSASAFDELLKIKDFRSQTLIECEKDCPKAKASASNVNVSELESQFIKIRTSGDGGWLIYSDANLPTWEATIDNQKTPIYTANYLFKSVFVPEGEHEIIFKYPSLWGQDKYAFKNLF
ncbi:MAG: hypothetical protein NTV77_03215 [Candidatus Azambacteria bacterium]|nr:hypothetical protein [Candidatus Azambacteria bacterium]